MTRKTDKGEQHFMAERKKTVQSTRTSNSAPKKGTNSRKTTAMPKKETAVPKKGKVGRPRKTDYQKPEETGLPAANVLIYKLENNETVIVRPSGTEPKIKIYYTTLGKNLAEAEAEKEKLAAAIEPMLV